jgi:hypothetical protein
VFTPLFNSRGANITFNEYYAQKEWRNFFLFLPDGFRAKAFSLCKHHSPDLFIDWSFQAMDDVVVGRCSESREGN